MDPGHVIAMVPIHPDSCNAYTSLVYRMFNVWLGGMIKRFRIIGTAFYGGGLYFVRVPPNFTEAQINAFTLEDFTAFPHTDLDPKNLSSIDLKLEDYRSGHFHQGPLDLTNYNSFGGWIVVVVNARLVTQSSELHSIDIRAEAAGNFTFKVPGPIRDQPTQATGPLSPNSLKLWALSGCDDVSTIKGSLALNVFTTTDRKFNNGNVFMRGAGGNYTYNVGVNASFPRNNDAHLAWEKIVFLARSEQQGSAANGVRVTESMWDMDHEGGNNAHQFLFENFKAVTSSKPTVWIPINFRLGSTSGVYVARTIGTEEIEFHHVESFEPFMASDRMRIQSTGTSNNPSPIFTQRVPDDHVWNTMGMDSLSPFLTPNVEDPAIGRESYVAFSTNYAHTLNAQPYEWGVDISNFQGWPAGQAALYSVHGVDGALVGKLKIRSNGHTYTLASPSTYIMEGNFLRFDQWMDENEPIPTTPQQHNAMINAAIQTAAKKAYSSAYKRMSKMIAGVSNTAQHK